MGSGKDAQDPESVSQLEQLQRTVVEFQERLASQTLEGDLRLRETVLELTNEKHELEETVRVLRVGIETLRSERLRFIQEATASLAAEITQLRATATQQRDVMTEMQANHEHDMRTTEAQHRDQSAQLEATVRELRILLEQKHVR